MFRTLALLTGLGLLVLASVGMGFGATRLEVWTVHPDSARETTLRFRGGERACVIVVGDHKPRSPTEVRVFDARGRLVAESKSPNDTAAVLWYPPVSAPYRVVIHNVGEIYNEMTVYFQGAEKR